MLSVEKKISSLVECINKNIRYKIWKVILLLHPVKAKATPVYRFNSPCTESTEERVIRNLENMTYEERLKEVFSIMF